MQYNYLSICVPLKFIEFIEIHRCRAELCKVLCLPRVENLREYPFPHTTSQELVQSVCKLCASTKEEGKAKVALQTKDDLNISLTVSCPGS